MTKIRETLKAFYADYSIYILPVIKFGLAVLVYMTINNMLGYTKIINNLFIILILAAVSAVLPLNGIVLIGMILIIVHSFGLGVEVGAFGCLLYLVIILLYFRFVPRDSLALLLTPVACTFQVPAVIPLCLGLMRGPESALSAAFGYLSWQYIRVVHDTIEPMKTSGDANQLTVLQTFPAELFSNQVILMMIAFAAAAIVVTIICKYLTTFTRETAIVTGTVVYLAIVLIGSEVLNLDTSALNVILGSAGSAVIALFMDSFVYQVDYSRRKYIQFEDDQYYYYVKAIPKITASPEESDEDDSAGGPGRDGRPPENGGQSGGAASDVDYETKLTNTLKDL